VGTIRALRAALPLALSLLLCWPAAAQTAAPEAWPSRPVRFVVPFPPGGPADVLARLYAVKLSGAWGQQVVVENRGGANGNIGAQAVAKSAPDGYTFLVHASSAVINKLLFKDPGYDPLTDFAPVSELADYKLVVVVHPSVPARTLKELVDLAKAKPGTVTYASAGGAGVPTHLAVEMFKQAAGVDLVHVPYAGAAPATNDLLAGHVMMMFNNPLSALPHVKAGKLRALAVASLQRLPLAPDVPTVAESGYPGFEAGTWFGMWAPRAVPEAIVRAAQAGVAEVAAMPEVRDQLAAQGLTAIGSTPEAFDRFQRQEMERWGRVIHTANITVE